MVDAQFRCSVQRVAWNVIQLKLIKRTGLPAGASRESLRPLSHSENAAVTSHSTIFDIPLHPLREDQKHQHRFTL